MKIFFNELSIIKANSLYEAEEWIKDFIDLYKIAEQKDINNPTQIKFTKNTLNIDIAPDYTFSKFICEELDRDKKRLFLSKLIKSPFIDDILEKESVNGKKLYEFQYESNNSYGLGAACLFDCISFSLDNHDKWNSSSIQITKRVLSEEDGDDIIETDEDVRHCSKVNHLEDHEDWIRNNISSNINNGKLLWLKRNDVFENLVLCKQVEDQIKDLKETNPEFTQIKKHLFELNTYCLSWDEGPFNKDDIPSKITPESRSRLDRFHDELNIECPDGIIRSFSLHLRYTPGAGRIYLLPDSQKKKIYIGYIGLKIE